MITLFDFVTISCVATLTAVGASHGMTLLRQARGIRSKSPARSNQEEESGRPSAGAWHVPRFGTRVPVDCRIEYLFECHQSEGRLVDMSRQGWRVKGLQPVAKGTTMTVQVYFPDSARPIPIDEAIVRWTEGLEFGVELIRISPESTTKLRTYLATTIQAPDSSSTYALSPRAYN